MGYQDLLTLLHRILDEKRIGSPEETAIRDKLKEGEIQDVIDNHLKKSFFFNNIDNPKNMLNRIRNQSNEEISSFTKGRFAGHLFYYVNFWIPEPNVKEVALIKKIGTYFGKEMTDDKCNELLTEWNINGVID